jgi:putative membrane protein
MAFGFVVVKFSLFLRQLSLLLGKNAAFPPPSGYSSSIGIVLVAVGAVVLLLAYLKYKKTEKQIRNEDFQPSSLLSLVLTVVILILSLLLIFYLVQNTSNASVHPFSI